MKVPEGETVSAPDGSPDAGPREPSVPIRFGMFSGPVETTEEDFRIAEFHGDPDDGLDWGAPPAARQAGA